MNIAMYEKAMVVTQAIATSVLDTFKAVEKTKVFTKLKEVTDVNAFTKELAQPMLEALRSSESVTHFKEAWQTFEDAEKLPHQIHTFLNLRRAAAAPNLADARSTIATMSGKPVADLNKAAGFQLSAVILQACLEADGQRKDRKHRAFSEKVCQTAKADLVYDLSIVPQVLQSLGGLLPVKPAAKPTLAKVDPAIMKVKLEPLDK